MKKNKKNPYRELLEITNVEKMKEYLCRVLSIENPTQKYWNNLIDIIKLTGKNGALDNAIREMRLSELPVPIRFRFKYFSDVYFEHNYYVSAFEIHPIIAYHLLHLSSIWIENSVKQDDLMYNYLITNYPGAGNAVWNILLIKAGHPEWIIPEHAKVKKYL